jgi:hypothetical protein
MTIVVGVAAPDGIILAADSRSTNLTGPHHRVASDNAIKLFDLSKCVGVATHGMAFIGDQTIAGLMDEFVANRADETRSQVTELAEELGTFFHDRLVAKYPNLASAQQGYALGFLVAGYDGDGVGRILEVSVPGPDVAEQVNTSSRGFLYRGMTDVGERLLLGVDWERLSRADVHLTPAAQKALRELEYRPIAPIALQDAIDFSLFLIRTTIDMQRFSDGTVATPRGIPGCGGPIRVLVITRSGPKWVSEHPLSAATASGLAEGGRA